MSMTQIPGSVVGSGLLAAVEKAAEQREAEQYQPVNYADLSPEHKKAWKATYEMMIYKFPGFQHMWNTMLSGQKLRPPYEYVPVFTRDIRIAATDGECMMANPDRYFQMGLLERIFVNGHEVLHNARGDVEFKKQCIASGYVPMNDGTKLPFVNHIFEESADLVINSALVKGRIGRMPVDKNTGLPIGLYDETIDPTTHMVDVYKKRYEDEQEGGEGGQPGQPGNRPGQGFDQLMPPGAATGNEQHHHRDKARWKVTIQQAETIEKHKNHGKMPAGLGRLFASLLQGEVPWVDHIETMIMRSVGDGSYDWREPDPYLGSTDSGDYFAPRPAGTGAGWIVVWGDTSGSRNQNEIASNIAELPPIMDAVQPERLTVCWGDAEVSSVDEITDMTDLKRLKPKGGGGTEMEPVLEWIKEQFPEEPALIIAFTDGYLDFPKETLLPCPIIWAISTNVVPPYGQRVQVCKTKRHIGA